MLQKSMAYLLIFAIVLSACNNKKQVSTIIQHATIYTADSNFTVAQAMAINDGKIVAVGSDSAINALYSSKEVIDGTGKTIFPGFIDAHCHFTGYATDMWKCNLVGTTSFNEIIEKLKVYSTNAPMEWIYGRGWDQNDWADKQYPNKAILDSLFPNRPVFLKRVDGHAALLNQKALTLAGIDVTTKIPGGDIEQKNGALTGILVDNAMHFAEKKVPNISDSLAKKYFNDAQAYCFAAGLTGVHDCGVSEHNIDLVKDAQANNGLKMKIFALLSDDTTYYEKWAKSGPLKMERLHVGGFKFYADGALGSRGACLLHDYSDKAGWKGFLLNTLPHFEKAAQLFANTDLQMCTHAIGDSGNRAILNIYANVLKGKNDKRWRIEHAQVVDASDFHYFTDYNIIPSVQPTHATSDMYWATDRLGAERIKNAYAFKKLLQTNGWIPLGTDFPVEYIEPIKTFYAAVTRQDSKGYPAAGFEMENALSRKEAIYGMTIWAAKSAFEEKEKGSLEKGKAADFIMLDTDLMTCNKNAILQTNVLGTWVNGEKVYSKK
ncbi:amidohydrolase [Ferruginibacter yonginensis]|uniref:Amidohydrolase n=1 Tax=Ferruginibacter yonginensis TaxID=1310416 RepID=A0ABV8QV93_9BACT